MIGIILFKYVDKHTDKEIYCYDQISINESGLALNQCAKFKIIGKDVDNIDWTNFTCSDKYEDLPECYGDNIYYSEFPLDIYCENCTIDGKICIEYHVTYYDYEDIKRVWYEQRFIGVWNDSLDNLSNTVKTCKNVRSFIEV